MGAERYKQLENEREIFLQRGRSCSKLTLPMVVRDASDDSNTSYQTPYQSVGARGVTNLASNMLLSLFPAGTPFFRLLVSDQDFEQFGEDAEHIKGEVEESLGKIEIQILEEIESKNLRSTIFEAVKNLLISGNTLLYVQPDGNIRNYSLEDYVTHRDVEGSITDITIKETISQTVAKSLDIDIELPSDMNGGGLASDKDICLYTCIELQDDGTYYAYQEVEGKILKDTKSYFSAEDLPWLPLRLSRNTGESYGRSYVETVAGDLKSLEALSKSVVESAAIAAKTVFFVDPATTTRLRDVAKAENGDVISGKSTDVSVLQSQKGSDLSIVMQAIQQYEQRLSYAFNLLEATIPSPGAKTATEINAIVNSLEKVLAGAYTMLASEMMAPLVHLIITRLQDEEKISFIPPEVKLIISTGLSALGRNTDLERMSTFFQLAMGANPEVASGMIDWEKAMRKLQDSVGVDILKTKDQLMAEQQAQMQMMQQQAQQQEQSQGMAQAQELANLAKSQQELTPAPEEGEPQQ
jgi:hypothetical protein